MIRVRSKSVSWVPNEAPAPGKRCVVNKGVLSFEEHSLGLVEKGAVGGVGPVGRVFEELDVAAKD